jgi:cell division septation protein DedD
VKNRKVILVIIRVISVFGILVILYVISTKTKNFFKITKSLISNTTQNRKEEKVIGLKSKSKKSIPIKIELTSHDTLTSPSKIDESNKKKSVEFKKKERRKTVKDIKSSLRKKENKNTLGYAVQLGFFTIREGAEEMVEDLLKRGYPAYLGYAPELEVKGFRVHVGNFKSRKEAEALVLKIKSQDEMEGFVTKINNN